MNYNPNIHHRRSIRLKGYDYSQAGLYFITICCEDRECRFGKIENDKMVLNELGDIAYNEWIKLSERFSNWELDCFQIMPNHMHGIIALNTIGAGFTPAPMNGAIPVQNDKWQPVQNDKGQPRGLPQREIIEDNIRTGASPVPTVAGIVGAYKSLVANNCLKIFKSKNEIMGKLWQRNYYENIIRNEQSYQNISDYIISNPAKWHDDKNFMK